MDLAKDIWRAKSRRMIGQTFKALVVAPGVARLESQGPDVDGVTHVDAGDVGEFVRVRLVSRRGFDFVGEVAQ